jgi:hypothetical protein
LTLEPNQSLFLLFSDSYAHHKIYPFIKIRPDTSLGFDNKWNIYFNPAYGGPPEPVIVHDLQTWTTMSDPAIKYYSGTAVYRNSFHWEKQESRSTELWISFDSIYNIATVKVNGKDCGTLWTPPYKLEITKACKKGENKIEVEVTNTWHNRLIGDNLLPSGKRVTWTTAPFRLKDKPLLPAGLAGNIQLILQ